MQYLPQRPDPADKSIFVEFHDEAVEDPKASAEQGAPAYKDQLFIRMVVDSFTEHDFEIKDINDSIYIKRFPDSWEMYKSKKTNQVVGMPLKALSWLTPAQIKNYEHADIYSVEQLVSSSDSRISKFMGGLDDRKKATKFLEEAKVKFHDDQLAKKLEAVTVLTDAQNEQIAALMKQNQELMAKLTSDSEKDDKKVKEKVK